MLNKEIQNLDEEILLSTMIWRLPLIDPAIEVEMETIPMAMWVEEMVRQ